MNNIISMWLKYSAGINMTNANIPIIFRKVFILLSFL